MEWAWRRGQSQNDGCRLGRRSLQENQGRALLVTSGGDRVRSAGRVHWIFDSGQIYRRLLERA